MGLGFYALTYLFVKEMENKVRVLVVVVLGVLTLFGSITVIGGFEGMPFGVLSVGILTI
ncbi:putative membrane protein [Peribacillus sp. V2I11]|nr:putative membrane protein [Peribacillus sp. V2I11]